jgi:hypothetical protein
VAWVLLFFMAKKLPQLSYEEKEQPMLSFIVSLVNHYEEHHGARPNLVYMNETHYEYLREELPGIRGHEGIVAILGVDIALSDSAIHPHVATAKLAAEHILVS